MSDRQDLQKKTREIHEALSRFEREQLVDILTHVFRIYVMEGAAFASPPPASILDELNGLSFAQLIERLQLRLDLPELALFEVQGNRVSVRAEGRLVPLDAPASRSEAPARPSAPSAAVTPAPAAPSTEPRPAPPPIAPAGHAGSPRPEATVRPPGNRVPGPAAAVGANHPSAVRPSVPPSSASVPATAPSAKPESKPAEDSSQGGRFGLLEID